jgi:hypothetical protein
MRNRRAGFFVAFALIAAATTGLTGCVTACPTIGFVNSDPAIVEFEQPLGDAVTVSACFGDECEPAPVAPGEGSRWEVPQSSPFADESTPIGSTRLRVVVELDGDILSDEMHHIPTATVRTGVFGQCPGPWRFDTLHIDIEGA